MLLKILYGFALLNIALACVRRRTVSPDRRCSYTAPSRDCLMIWEDGIIVYDSQSGKCFVKDFGCDPEDVEPYGFDTMEECRTTCSANVDTKCTYEPPEYDCAMYWLEGVILYDSISQECFRKHSGCDRGSVVEYGFDSFVDCLHTCTNMIIDPYPVDPPTTSRSPKCSFRDDYACYSDNRAIVYIPETDQCYARTLCDSMAAEYSFFNYISCELTCKLEWGSGSHTTTEKPVDKCSFELINLRDCPVSLGEERIIVFDSQSGHCIATDTNCNDEYFLLHSFESEKECWLTCSNYEDRKCSYVEPDFDCEMYWEDGVILYDSNLRECFRKHSGCDRDSLLESGFHSFVQCEKTCNNLIIDPYPIDPPTTTRNPLCGFRDVDNCDSNEVAVVYIPEMDQCYTRRVCSFSALSYYTFLNYVDCELACKLEWGTGSLVTTEKPVDKCSFTFSNTLDCSIYDGFRGFFVFDSQSGKCIDVTTIDCFDERLRLYSFATEEECRKTCSPHVSRKCTYEEPEGDCRMYWEKGVILYDSNSRECFRKHSGCDRDSVLPYGFHSFVECEEICNNLIIEPYPIGEPTTTRSPKCEFRDERDCPATSAGIVYLPGIDECYESQTCASNGEPDFSFSGFTECELTCKQNLYTPIGHVDKCSYVLIEDVCLAIWESALIVFDSGSGKCVEKQSGCNADASRPFSFDNMRECNSTCQQEEGTTTIAPADRCAFRVHGLECDMAFEEDFFLFDYRSGECIMVNSGCDPEMLRPYSFPSKKRCEWHCLNTDHNEDLIQST